MTAEPNAVVRLRRALENDRCTVTQIRAIVAELPRPPGLEDALAILLALLDREPATYPRAAARWGSRFALERRLTLVDAQLVLAALAVLPESTARAGVETLAELTNRYGLRRVDELLIRWADRRGLGS
ncbi:MAG: hypothetical protein ACR2ND_14115 [Solirubrobacteraceae bacterium]